MAPAFSLRGVVGARGGGFRVEIPALDVAPGALIAIVGRSGSGKSTILDMLAGILRPADPGAFHAGAAGRSFDLARLWRADDKEGLRAFRAAMIGYVMQTGGLAPFLSIEDNVALPFWRDGLSDPGAVADILALLGLAGEGAKMPREVSVGQRQRVAVARAMAARPPVVLADEPTASLDPHTAEAVMGLLAGAARDRNAALVVVTHDEDLAARHGFDILRCRAVAEGVSRLDLREGDGA